MKNPVMDISIGLCFGCNCFLSYELIKSTSVLFSSFLLQPSPFFLCPYNYLQLFFSLSPYYKMKR